MKAASIIGSPDKLSGHPGSLATGIAGLSASIALPATRRRAFLLPAKPVIALGKLEFKLLK
jgi:hypothetical protein